MLEYLVNRSKLGHGNQGQPDDKSGLFQKNVTIEQLEIGHVALLKGESWLGNEGAGLVHRSPHTSNEYNRLYMTIDFFETYINIYRNFCDGVFVSKCFFYCVTHGRPRQCAFGVGFCNQ